MPTFGTVGFQQLRENKKIVYIKLSEAFLDMNGLEYNPNMAEFEQNSPIVLVPLIKPAFHDMAKTANMEKGVFYSTLLNILNLIGELLGESPNVEVDLGEYGKFQGMNR